MVKTLSNSDIREMNAQFFAKYGLEPLNKKDLNQIHDNLLLVNKEPYFFMHEKQWVPALKLIIKNNFMKKITVDMGAVKFIVSGADIMRPGVVEVDNGINKNDFVVIVDVNNKKPLAIGQALFSSEEIKRFPTGRVVKTLHYVGDEIWRMQ